MELVLLAISVTVSAIAILLGIAMAARLREAVATLKDVARRQDELELELAERDRRWERLRQQLSEAQHLLEASRLDEKAMARLQDQLETVQREQEHIAELARQARTEQRAGSETAPSLASSQAREVVAMLEAGKTAAEIAGIKGVQVGEVELIKSLGQLAAKDGAKS